MVEDSKGDSKFCRNNFGSVLCRNRFGVGCHWLQEQGLMMRHWLQEQGLMTHRWFGFDDWDEGNDEDEFSLEVGCLWLTKFWRLGIHELMRPKKMKISLIFIVTFSSR